MSDLIERLRHADAHSQQRVLGSRIFGAAADEIQRLRSAMQEACNLLAERTHGSPARSLGHNARLVLETALHGAPAFTLNSKEYGA